MQTENTQPLIPGRLSTPELKSKLGRLNSAYHICRDRQTRQTMLLYMDELKLELYKREKNDKPI